MTLPGPPDPVAVMPGVVEENHTLPVKLFSGVTVTVIGTMGPPSGDAATKLTEVGPLSVNVGVGLVFGVYRLQVSRYVQGSVSPSTSAASASIV